MIHWSLYHRKRLLLECAIQLAEFITAMARNMMDFIKTQDRDLFDENCCEKWFLR